MLFTFMNKYSNIADYVQMSKKTAFSILTNWEFRSIC